MKIPKIAKNVFKMVRLYDIIPDITFYILFVFFENDIIQNISLMKNIVINAIISSQNFQRVLI